MTGISVFTYDGILVYEGPLRAKVDGDWEVYTGPIRPHQTVETLLSFYDLPGGDREVDMVYTVEIFWSWADKKGLPLTGWVSIVIIKRDAVAEELIEMEFGGTSQMMNMEQTLTPEKTK